MADPQYPVSELAKRYGVSRTTIYKGLQRSRKGKLNVRSKATPAVPSWARRPIQEVRRSEFMDCHATLTMTLIERSE
jgi:transposase-like protein